MKLNMAKKDTNIDDELMDVDVQDDELTAEEQRLEKERIRLQRRTSKKAKVYEDNDDAEDDNDENDEEDDEFEKLTFRNVIGGDILQSKFVMSKVMFIMFCALLMVLYTGNRYGSLQDIITIDSLHRELVKVHNKQVTQSSDLLNLSRQSNIERKLEEMGDTVMLQNNTPPFALTDE